MTNITIPPQIITDNLRAIQMAITMFENQEQIEFTWG